MTFAMYVTYGFKPFTYEQVKVADDIKLLEVVEDIKSYIFDTCHRNFIQRKRKIRLTYYIALLSVFSYPKDLGLLQNNPQPGAHEMCYAGVVAYPVVVDNTSTMFTTQLMLGLWFVTNLALMP